MSVAPLYRFSMAMFSMGNTLTCDKGADDAIAKGFATENPHAPGAGDVLPWRTMTTGNPKSYDSVEDRVYREKATLAQMVGIYCAGNRHDARPAEAGPVPAFAADMPEKVQASVARMCPDCRELTEYCFTRIDHCPHMAVKTFCSSCLTHCYSPAMRERVRETMRYAGPRMIFHDPLGALTHMRDTLRAKKAQ